MDKKALVGKLILLAVVILIVMGTSFYISFKKNGLEFRTGKVIFNIQYNSSANSTNESMGFQEPPKIIEDKGNSSLENLSEEGSAPPHTNLSNYPN